MNDQNEFWGKSFRKKEEIVHRSIAGETILVPVKGKLADMQRIFTLNPVADFIWNQLNGGKTVSEIRDEVIEHFEVARENAEQDIREFIEELIREDLLAEV
ncbi:MAG: PqqD family protein [Nitrospirota bacterium]